MNNSFPLVIFILSVAILVPYYFNEPLGLHQLLFETTKKADLDGNGSVSLEEFINFIKSKIYSDEKRFTFERLNMEKLSEDKIKFLKERSKERRKKLEKEKEENHPPAGIPFYTVYRYGTKFMVEKSNVHSIDELLQKASDYFDDKLIYRLVTMKGIPIHHWSQIENEVIALNSEELFMWPTKYVGYETWVQSDRNITIKTLSLRPRVFELKNLLSKEECELIIEKAKPIMKQSTVGGEHKSATVSQVRTSDTGWIHPGESPDVDVLVNRISNLTTVPTTVFEAVQIVHYKKNQHYYEHHDWIQKKDYPHNPYYSANGNRYITVLYYLTDVPKGGETIFPHTNPSYAFKGYGVGTKYEELCTEEFKKNCLKMPPKAGDAIMFYNLVEEGIMEGEVDWDSLHSGCDVIEGDKWASNLWIRNKRVNGKLYDENW